MAKGARRNGQGRRAYLKRFSADMISTGSSIDKGLLREASQRAHALTHRDIAFRKLYGLEPTPANELARKERGERTPFLVETPRDRTLRQLVDYTNGIEPTHNICLLRMRVYMFWSHHYYFLLEYNASKGTFRRSMRYASRDALMSAFHHNYVKWKREPDAGITGPPAPYL